MQWLVLQQDEPKDFVIGRGVQHSVREFITTAAGFLGSKIRFEGNGINGVGIVENVDGIGPPNISLGQEIIKVDARYFRLAEVEILLGDAALAKRKLDCEPQITSREMCEEMVAEDYKAAQRQVLLKASGLCSTISSMG